MQIHGCETPRPRVYGSLKKTRDEAARAARNNICRGRPRISCARAAARSQPPRAFEAVVLLGQSFGVAWQNGTRARKRHAMNQRYPKRDVYSASTSFDGETYAFANNYADCLVKKLHDPEDVLVRKVLPVARRVLGENGDITLRMRNLRAGALQGRQRHARRSPRGRDDARGRGTDRAARARWRAPNHRRD